MESLLNGNNTEGNSQQWMKDRDDTDMVNKEHLSPSKSSLASLKHEIKGSSMSVNPIFYNR